jgi:hypothetical protein
MATITASATPARMSAYSEIVCPCWSLCSIRPGRRPGCDAARAVRLRRSRHPPSTNLIPAVQIGKRRIQLDAPATPPPRVRLPRPKKYARWPVRGRATEAGAPHGRQPKSGLTIATSRARGWHRIDRDVSVASHGSETLTSDGEPARGRYLRADAPLQSQQPRAARFTCAARSFSAVLAPDCAKSGLAGDDRGAGSTAVSSAVYRSGAIEHDACVRRAGCGASFHWPGLGSMGGRPGTFFRRRRERGRSPPDDTRDRLGTILRGVPQSSDSRSLAFAGKTGTGTLAAR